MDVRLSLLLVILSAIIALCNAKKYPNKAVCIVDKSTGMADVMVEGHILFEQKKDEMEIKVNLKGFKGPVGAPHGFHVHELGNMSSNCKATGGHYNPENKNHGAPNDTVRHVGDLGNIYEQTGGVIETEFEDKVIKLNGTHAILNRAIVIHAGKDDLGKGGKSDSLTTGNAGGRIGCCLIVDDIPENLIGGTSELTRNVFLLVTSAIFALYVRL